ncbi:MAG: pyridoxal-phosphate dependent enzyme, partial [Planctomycetota bacterium]|nr:pyridoxal-phosphate dependent enzyme [Planctomycetota bacterium]
MTARAFESRLVCTGCGAEAERDDPFAFRCPAAEEEAGEKGDHVLARELDLTETSFPQPSEEDGGNPFVRYRELLHSWRLARRRGMPDAGYVRLVHELDGAVAEVDGRGFVVTPYARNEALGKELGLESGGWGGPSGGRGGLSGGRGGLWIKDETANVAGSHKARHLMGLALLFEVAKRTGDARPVRLAVASCGPAALAAAVIARASARPLDAYIPPNANEVVVRNLMDLGAKLHVCERPADGPPGDPCQHRFREAVRPGGTGALP